MPTRINLQNIQTLTDFKRNAKDYVEKIKLTKSPLVLTVNGKAEVVVQEAQEFQQMLDRLQNLEEELQKLKLAALRNEINIGIQQLENGEYTEYDEESLTNFFANIEGRVQKNLADSGSV